MPSLEQLNHELLVYISELSAPRDAQNLHLVSRSFFFAVRASSIDLFPHRRLSSSQLLHVVRPFHHAAGLNITQGVYLTHESLGDVLAILPNLKCLKLVRCQGLTALPRTVGNSSRLRSLTLAEINLSSLPEEISGLSCLQELVLKRCRMLRGLPETIGSLTALLRLDLEGCLAVTGLPEGIGGLSALQCLCLKLCIECASLPEGFSGLVSLQKLDLTSCSKLPCLPAGFGCLASLKVMFLPTLSMVCWVYNCVCGAIWLICPCVKDSYENDLCRVLVNLTGIGCMGFSASFMFSRGSEYCAVAGVPHGLLRIFIFYVNQDLLMPNCGKIEELPEEISCLGALTRLVLEGCPMILALPEGLCRLASLGVLEVGKCYQLAALPEHLGGLISLHTLSVGPCHVLSALPTSLSQLLGLRSLSLISCREVRALPAGLTCLTLLEALDLHGSKKLGALPDGLEALSGLSRLDLGDCERLAALPRGTGELSALLELDLSGCTRLEPLSLECLGKLTALRRLSLANLKLAALPGGLEALTQLRKLTLANCRQLSGLPEGLRELSALTELDLEGCTGLGPGAISEGLRALGSLRKLRLAELHLTELPEGLESLVDLSSLEFRVFKPGPAGKFGGTIPRAAFGPCEVGDDGLA